MAAPFSCSRRLFFSQRFNIYSFSFQCFPRTASSLSVKDALKADNINQHIKVKGWVKNLQQHKGVMFLHLNDGTGPKHLQVVVPQPISAGIDATFGSCVEVEGTLKKSQGKGQSVELLSSSVNLIGPCDLFEFPFKQRAKHSAQYTRDYLHLRPRTNIFAALLRIRDAASMAVHSYFQNDGYVFIHTPILVTNDCEGGCQVFKVDPLIPHSLNTTSQDIDTNDDDTIERGPDKDRSNHSSSSDASKQFFGQPAYLTVSGQLHLEIMTGALTKVYNFGPCFRAENNHGSYHLSEFYMVEAEMAFIETLEPLLEVMQGLVKHVYQVIMDTCPEDVALFAKFVAPPEHQDALNRMMTSHFERLSYTEAVQIIEKSKDNFKKRISWGCDLDKEHEMFLTHAVGDRPVFVTDYPTELRPFYALRNDDSKTVAAADLLMPGVGELCGSSLREHRLDVLKHVLANQKNMVNEIDWYLQLREFGTCPHGGFGLGFERLLLAILGASSVKDVIPFPRWVGRCLT